MESTAAELALDPISQAMENLTAAGIDFEVVSDRTPDEPPGGNAPPPAGTGGGKEAGEAAPSESVIESRRVPLSEWRQALREADLTATEHHVALAYADHMRFKDDHDRVIPEARCWPSAETIARETHRSRATIYKTLGSLEAKGWIHWERRGGASPVIWATVPDGGDVIPFPRESHPRDTRDRRDSLTHETESLTHETGESHPRDTEVEAEVAKEVSAAPSLTEDQELFEAMLDLAEHTSGVRSPKAWVAKVYAEDIAPIIESEGRDAALAEIHRRRFRNYRPPSTDHGDQITATDHW